MPRIFRLSNRLPDERQDIVDRFILAKNMATSRVLEVRLRAQTEFHRLFLQAPKTAPYIAAVQQIVLTHDPNRGVRTCARIISHDLQEECGAKILKLNVRHDPSLERLKSSLDAVLPPPNRRSRMASPCPKQ